MLLDNSPLVLIILTTASTIFDMSRSEPDGLMDFMKKDKKIEKAEPQSLGLESFRVISDDNNNNNRKEASPHKVPQLQNGALETNNIETVRDPFVGNHDDQTTRTKTISSIRCPHLI